MGTGADQFDDAVDVLLSADLTRLSGADVLELARRLEVGRRRLAAVDHRMLAEMESRRLAGEYARATTVDLLVSELRVTPAEARARVAHSADLGPRVSFTGEVLEPLLPITAAACLEGVVSPGHVQAVRDCVNALPAELDTPEVLEVVESVLVEAARVENPRQLARTATMLLDRLNPDGSEPREQDLERRRCLSLTRGRDGSGRLRGELTPEVTAVWEAILDSLSAPAASTDGERDHRSPNQRTHDALAEAGMRLLRSGTLPANGGVPVTVLVRTTQADLDAATRDREPPTADVPATADTQPATPAGADGRVPASGTGLSSRGDVLSLRTLLRFSAADIEILPVVMGERGDVLHLGRTKRLANRPLRFALAARDGGCCFPGCDKPATWTEVHHIREWQDGGATDIDNLCLLCRYHHREFERRGWTVRISNGVPEWLPPPWIDPARRPRRNRAHHPPDIEFSVVDLPAA